jgi:hypothetical protein
MGFPYFTLISCILILILIITTTLAIVFFLERQEAYHYVSPWCNVWTCNCTSDNPPTGTALWLQTLQNCLPNPETGLINLGLCSCSTALWNQFYDPSDPNNFDTPPANTIPNNCIDSYPSS